MPPGLVLDLDLGLGHAHVLDRGDESFAVFEHACCCYCGMHDADYSERPLAATAGSYSLHEMPVVTGVEDVWESQEDLESLPEYLKKDSL